MNNLSISVYIYMHIQSQTDFQLPVMNSKNVLILLCTEVGIVCCYDMMITCE